MATCLSPQLLEDERFQELSEQRPVSHERWDVRVQQRRGKAGIADMQLRALDQPAQTVAMPGWESFQQEESLKKRRVGTYRRAAEPEWRRQLGEVEESGRLRGGAGQQPGQDIQRSNARHVTHVALDQCLDIVTIPVGLAPGGRTRQRRWKSPRDQPLDELFTEPRRLTNRKAILEQGVQESSIGTGIRRGGPRRKLILGQRM